MLRVLEIDATSYYYPDEVDDQEDIYWCHEKEEADNYYQGKGPFPGKNTL
jgi:hypothetical protein